ncbi:MAG: choice-of-anchor Q domain-containing protein [Candidatus Binataceae bacterium]
MASKWLAILGIAADRATISPPSKGSFGININSRSYVAIEHVHTDGGEIGIVSSGGGGHWYVNDDEVENAIGSGVQLNNGDYISVLGSLIHGNAAIWSNAGSGVSVYDPIQLDSARGPHIYIGANIIYDNSNPRGASDGNAIILDSFSDNRFAASSLIENNVAYGNAGACIKVYSNGGAPVLARNNTCFKNQQLVSKYTWRGEISLEFSGGVTSVNNILWFDPTADSSNSGYLNGGSSGSANVAVSNLSYGGSSGSNPMLVSPPTDMRLQSGSPAIGTGSTAYGIPAVDLIGALRSTKSVDIGAYAYGAASAAATPIGKASATPKATATPRSTATVSPTAIQTPTPRIRVGA